MNFRVFQWKYISSTVLVKVAQSCPNLCNPMDRTAQGILQATGVGSLSLLQGIFPTQGLNPPGSTLVPGLEPNARLDGF